MQDLRLGLVINAIDNSPAVFGRFGRNATTAVEVASRQFARVQGVTERVTQGIAGLGIGVGIGLEAKQALDDSERFERIGSAARMSDEKLKEFRATIYGVAADAKVSASELIAGWDEGAATSGATVDQYIANAKTIATYVQLIGGQGTQLGETLGQFGKAGVTSAGDVSRAFSTLREQLVGTGLSFQEVAPHFGALAYMYGDNPGHGGPDGAREIGAVMGTIAMAAPNPKTAFLDTAKLLSIISNQALGRPFSSATGIPIYTDGTFTKTRSLTDIVHDIAAQAATPGPNIVIDRALGPELTRGLAAIFADEQKHGRDNPLDQRLAMKGAPERDARDATEIGASFTGTINAIQDKIRQEGVWFDRAMKPLWRFIGAHAGIASVAADAIVGITGFGLACRILKPGVMGSFKAIRLFGRGIGALRAIVGDLVAGVFPAILEGFMAVGAAIEATPIGWIATGIAAIAAGATLIYRNWEPIKAWWKRLWGGAADDVDGAQARIDKATAASGHTGRGDGNATGRAVGHAIWGRMTRLWRSVTGEEAQARSDQALAYFQSRGWSAAQSAGIVANLMRESRMNETAFGDRGRAYGLAQWHGDRANALAAHFGRRLDQMGFGEQLAAVDWELRAGGERAAGDALSRTAAARDAGALTSILYERPGDAKGEADARGGMADELMRRIGQATTAARAQIAITIDGLPQAARATVKSSDADIDLGLGYHMAPAQ